MHCISDLYCDGLFVETHSLSFLDAHELTGQRLFLSIDSDLQVAKTAVSHGVIIVFDLGRAAFRELVRPWCHRRKRRESLRFWFASIARLQKLFQRRVSAASHNQARRRGSLGKFVGQSLEEMGMGREDRVRTGATIVKSLL